MYNHFFKLAQSPFSIAPDPRYLFMSERHREALAHLLYGIDGGGGFVLLTGEIGAGKTTVCRCFLEQIPVSCNVAYVYNSKLTVIELLKSICDEFDIGLPRLPTAASVKDHVDALNGYLLMAHSARQNNVLIIDEAQNLSVDVLEQLRLLTNLETNQRKLLQIILIGQPELRSMLARPELEQLAQRVIARYHLGSLSESETVRYIAHRLSIAGLHAESSFPTGPEPFQPKVAKQVHRIACGVPRRINLLCDRALLGAYAEGKRQVNHRILRKATVEVFGEDHPDSWPRRRKRTFAGIAVLSIVVMGATWLIYGNWGWKPITPVVSILAASEKAPPAVATALVTATSTMIQTARRADTMASPVAATVADVAVRLQPLAATLDAVFPAVRWTKRLLIKGWQNSGDYPCLRGNRVLRRKNWTCIATMVSVVWRKSGSLIAQ
jgi:general secretion pathway protein A